MTNKPPWLNKEITEEIKSQIPQSKFKLYKEEKVKFLKYATFRYDVDKYIERIQKRHCIISSFMIARPAFATCPVKTLLIFFENEQCIKENLKLESFDDILKLQEQNQLPDVIFQEKNDRYEYIEFKTEFQMQQKRTYNPAVCIQFLKPQTSVIQLDLKCKRKCRYSYIILVDIDDRRQLYNTNPDLGLDISFVVFGGHILND